LLLPAEISENSYLFGQIRNIFCIRTGFFVICLCLLPEGDSQLPTVKTDSLYVLPLHLSSLQSITARLGSRALRKGITFFRLFGHAQKAETFWVLCTTGGFSRQSADWLRMTVLLGRFRHRAGFSPGERSRTVTALTPAARRAQNDRSILACDYTPAKHVLKKEE